MGFKAEAAALSEEEMGFKADAAALSEGGGYSDPYSHLWCAVVLRLKADIEKKNMDSSYSRADRSQARDWVGSRGFTEVCEMAGLDPDAALEAFQKIL